MWLGECIETWDQLKPGPARTQFSKGGLPNFDPFFDPFSGVIDTFHLRFRPKSANNAANGHFKNRFWIFQGGSRGV